MNRCNSELRWVGLNKINNFDSSKVLDVSVQKDVKFRIDAFRKVRVQGGAGHDGNE